MQESSTGMQLFDELTHAKPDTLMRFEDFHEALRALESRPPEWYRHTYAATCQMCLDSWPSRRLLLSVSDYQLMLMRLGGDYSIPLVVLAAIMLHAGYLVGRKHAETEMLAKWMKL